MAEHPNPAHLQKSEAGSKTPLHYRLTHEEWVRAVKELTPAQKDVLYYIRTLDPFGDRTLNLGVRSIAKVLGCDPGTVSRALKALDAKGYIDLDLIRVGVRVKTRPKVLPQNNSVASEQQCCAETTVLRSDHECCSDATPMILTQQTRSPRNTCEPEPAQDNGSGSLHTIHTYSTSLKREKERFEVDSEFRSWLLAKSQRLPVQPALIEQWIESQAQVEANQREFLKDRESRVGAGVPPPLPPVFEENCRLVTLRRWWLAGQQERVENWIADNPDCGIAIDESGPVEVQT